MLYNQAFLKVVIMKKVFTLIVLQFLFWPYHPAFGEKALSDESLRAKILTTESGVGNRHSQSFYAVKKEMLEKIYFDHRITLYCRASFDGFKRIDKTPVGFCLPDLRYVDFNVYNADFTELQKKAQRMEWEHIVPAQNFGKSFKEWSEGHPRCVSQKGKKFKGRSCAEQENEEFRYMYTDMYNLYPSIGAVNYLRSNFNFAELPTKNKETFCNCDGMRISQNKVMPSDKIKGLIARTYLYMQKTYPRYSIGEPMQGVLRAWNRKYPVTRWECRRAYRIEKVQGNANNVVKSPCLEKGWYRDNQ